MADAPGTQESPDAPASGSDYDVVVLIEEPLTAADVRQVRSLHEGIDVTVTYHVLLPLEDAAARVEAAMGSLSAHDMAPGPGLTIPEVDLAAVRAADRDRCNNDLAATLALFDSAGATATGEIVTAHPVDALAAKVTEVDGREVIILTRPHVVAEFFHVDWTHQARRKIGVPILHLLERENFDEQAGGGEGVTGL